MGIAVWPTLAACKARPSGIPISGNGWDSLAKQACKVLLAGASSSKWQGKRGDAGENFIAFLSVLSASPA